MLGSMPALQVARVGKKTRLGDRIFKLAEQQKCRIAARQTVTC